MPISPVRQSVFPAVSIGNKVCWGDETRWVGIIFLPASAKDGNIIPEYWDPDQLRRGLLDPLTYALVVSTLGSSNNGHPRGAVMVTLGYFGSGM